ncbi:hypothetical protein Agub_g4792 [Astrephomene gubernaculifera]|uniref:Uncharacterized protein n=1 Tax=Astrephomene gubernaculifera TaxID=47775 RepID=A0AAD3HJJ4_9CHLO|nr:hypothetical protein Agub_g4792 [Astrephomene gubernaculifera]
MLLHAARRFAALPAGCSNLKGSSVASRLLLAGRGVSTGSCSAVGSNMHDNDPQALAHHKEKALKGESPSFVPNTEGWTETLASLSEAVVKAELNVDADSTSVPEKLEELQRHTIHVVQQLHHEGEEGMPETPKRTQHDVSGSPAHSANIEHMRNAPGMDPR